MSQNSTIPEAMLKDLSITPEEIDKTIELWDVEPYGNKCFVATIGRDRSAGGIYIPQDTAERCHEGVVIAAGPTAYVPKGEPDERIMHEFLDRGFNIQEARHAASLRPVRPGDRVSFAAFSGATVTREHLNGRRKLMVMNDEDLLGDIVHSSKEQ